MKPDWKSIMPYESTVRSTPYHISVAVVSSRTESISGKVEDARERASIVGSDS